MIGSKVLADISVAMWLRCRELGLVACVKCSYMSVSRYLHIKDGITIRLSDHEHRDGRAFDYQIIATSQDKPDVKMAEAMALLERLVGVPSAAAS